MLLKVKTINIEAHTGGTCVPDKSNEYPVRARTRAARIEAFLAKLLPKLPHARARANDCTYVRMYVARIRTVQKYSVTLTYVHRMSQLEKDTVGCKLLCT